MPKLKIILLSLLGVFIPFSVQAVYLPVQGGTGLSSITSGQVNGFLQAVSSSPFTYALTQLLTTPSYPVVITVPTPVTVTTSLTETNIVNVQIPPNTLANNRALEVTALIDSLQNNTSGNNVTTTFRLYYGGTLVDTFPIVLSNIGSGGALSGNLTARILANGSVSSQVGSMFFSALNTAASFGSKSGVNQVDSMSSIGVDSTQSQTLRITVQQSRNTGGNQQITMRNALVNLLSASAAGDVFATTTNIFSAPNYFTSSTYSSNAYFAPCFTLVTSTANTTGATGCLEDRTTTVTTSPYTNIAVNPNFADGTTDYPTGWVTTSFNFNGGPGAGDGSETNSKNTVNCNGAASCLAQDFLSPSDGSGQGSFLDQTFTYDPSRTFDGQFDFQREHNDPRVSNLTCLAWTNFPVADVFSAPVPGDAFWSFVSSSWTEDLSTILPDGFDCSADPSTAWQTLISTSTPTGPMGRTTGHFVILTALTDPSASTDTVYLNHVNFGAATSTVTSTTGINQFVFTSPTTSHPFVLQGAPVLINTSSLAGLSANGQLGVDGDAGFSGTVAVGQNIIVAGTSTATTLVVTGGATTGDVLGAVNGTGLIGYVPPDSLGPWTLTPLLDGYYLKNNKSACVGSASSSCDLYSQGSVVADNLNTINNIAGGDLDAGTQNQQVTFDGQHGNKDASYWFTSASTPTTTSGQDMGADNTRGRTTWFAKNLAFRAGYVDNHQWDNINQGILSTAFGYNTVASGFDSFAWGNAAEALGTSTLMFGNGNIVGNSSMGFGTGVQFNSAAPFSYGVGESLTATASHCHLFGDNLTCSATDGTAIGSSNLVSGAEASVLGDGSTASGTASLALGNSSVASGNASVAMGGGIAAGDSSLTVGSCIAGGPSSICMGTNIDAEGQHSVGISLDEFGVSDPVVSQDNTLSIMGGKVGIGTTTPQSALSVVGDVTVSGGNSTGQCTLNGLALAQCTHTVPAGSLCVANEDTTSAPNTLGTSVSGTTLTITSALTLDTDVVTYHCF